MKRLPAVVLSVVSGQDGEVAHTFPCGTLPLDFVGTLQARRNPQPHEKLDSPASLDSWFVESGLLHEEPGSDGGDLDAARELRASIYALVEARLTGVALPPGALAVVNERASGLPVSIQLGHDGARRSGTAAHALSSLAREAVEIIGGEDGALLRECGRPGCTQVYLDRSRGRRREWCAMRTCGNRIKASNYRARHRGESREARAGAAQD